MYEFMGHLLDFQTTSIIAFIKADLGLVVFAGLFIVSREADDLVVYFNWLHYTLI